MIATKQKLYTEFKDYFFITIGLLMYAVGYTCFLLPYEITTGGVAGISAIIYYSTGIEVQYSYLVINGVLLMAAIKILGLKFCIKTVYAVLTLTVMLTGVQELFKDENGVLIRSVGDETFMACIVGACLEGVGLAVVFLNNGSTGGTDIIASIVNKYRDVTLGRMLIYCDIIIISSCYFVFYDWQRVLFGFCTLIVANVMVDYIMNSAQQSVQFFVFSKKYGEIADEINVQMHRGVTVLDGTGWYNKQPMKVLVVMAKKRESVSIFRIIKNIDVDAFVSQSNVVGVYGEGFDRIKVK